MTSSERILAGIAEEGQKQSDAIIAEANAKADAVMAAAETEAKKKADAVIQEAEKKAVLIRSSGKSAAALLVRDAALLARRELIAETLADTVADICAFEDEKYFSFLFTLIERGKMEGNGEVLLNARDLARDLADFRTKLSALSLTLSETPADIEGGFVLKYNDIYINGELSALIREKREELVDSIHSILFQ